MEFLGGDVYICPGTYRVRLHFGGFGIWAGPRTPNTLIGRGSSPSDVVLDAAGMGLNATVVPWGDLDQDGPTEATLRNLTLTNGSAAVLNGCVQVAPTCTMTYESALVTGCTTP